MHRTKIKHRLKNAAAAFYDDSSNEMQSLSRANGAAIRRIEEPPIFTGETGFWLNLARQAFLFLPGAFLLHFAAMTSVFLLPELGLTPLMLFHFLVGVFLCQVGLGDLRNTKNLLIPFSIAGFAAVLGIVSFALPTEWRIAFCFEYSIYFFPLALVGSKLLRNFLDDE